MYKFKDYVYELYAPYYDEYKGHTFVIDHYMPEDPSREHVWLKCVDYKTVEMEGYFHFSDLELSG